MENSFTAFAGARQIAHGALAEVTAAAAANYLAGASHLLIFDDATGKLVDLDLRQGRDALAEPHRSSPAPRGRPKLGVTAREVTLLPSHWEWLARQPGGASAALRRLVDQARRAAPNQIETVRNRLYRVMLALAGDHAGYEEANRALFSGDLDTLKQIIGGWPEDICAYLMGSIEQLRALSHSRPAGAADD
ncbi:MAG TPA: DUF2239 family protein [Phenylobacterium sp.]|uniref:DUF2239 family protein n=1 Tax=Phenylobacterium sp. TaxID=1871053 RepID=UPI002F92D2E5